MSEERDFAIAAGSCNGCGGCAEIQPEYVGWQEGEERPFLLSDVAPDAVISELAAFCPEDCFDDC